MASADTSPRGHLIVKSHAPLPRFACAVPVPHPDVKIDQLRTTIVAILTGQVSVKASSSTVNGSGVGSNGAKAGDAPLSYSEHVKQVTIHEWRMKSLVLELRQNSLIAPETRGVEEDEGASANEGIRGFELLDDHECSLLEHGDEVNLWLRPGQTFESLRLPKLSSKHIYGLPNQPALDRSGTMLLGDNSASSTGAASDFAFTSPSPIVREPMEPSSHSSSVSANPDINFETTNRHWTAPNQQHRIVTVAGLSSSNALAPAAKKNVKPREKPKRLNSASYFSPQLVDQKQREKYGTQRSKSGPINTIIATQSPEVLTTRAIKSPEVQVTPRSPIVSSPTSISNSNGKADPHLDQPSSPSLVQNDAITSQLKARQASFIRAEKQERDSKMRKAVEQKKMPSGALIVGPGVQGKVGNLPPSYTRNGGPERKQSGVMNQTEGTDSYGNRAAFVSYTAASSDAYKPVRPHVGKMRRASSRSDLLDKEKVDKTENRRPSERRQSSFSKLLERKQSEASIKKVDSPPATTSTSHPLLQPLLKPLVQPPTKKSSAPSPAPVASTTADAPGPTATTSSSPAPAPSPTNTRRLLDILPPMPMPKLIRTGSLSKSWQDLLQPLSAPFTPATPPAAQILASPVEEKEPETVIPSPIYAMYTQAASGPIDEEPSSSQLQDTASSTQHQESIFSTPNDEEMGASSSSTDPTPAATPAAPVPPTSKAEKRYQEVMKAIEVEREKQSQDEKLRKEAAARREEAKLQAKLKLEEDQQKRKETLKWQMWEEVRARQEKDKSKGRRR